MQADPLLTLAFIERKPAAAARILQDLDTADAAEFLGQAPARLAGPVLEVMVPWAAASCMELLDPETAAGLIQTMTTQGAASILRLLPDELRNSVLELLSRSRARALGATLSYPRDTVGSWMDHNVPSFPETTTVGEALRYLRTRRRRPASPLFVVGERREFVGVVEFGELLKSNDKASLLDIIDQSVRPLSNRARLTSIAAEPDWDRFNSLPVVGRRKNFLGALSRKQLRSGLGEGAAKADGSDVVSLFSHLASALVLSWIGTVQTITTASPAYSSQPKQGGSHGR